MKRSLAFAAGLIALGGLAFALTSSHVTAQKKGKTRPLTTAQMMSGLVKPQLVALKGLVEEGKKVDGEEGWKAVSTSIALLNESGHMMMEDGRCPDKIWADACKVLREATEEGLKKAAQKDVDGVRASLEGVLASCKGCHAEHKYKNK